MQQTDAVPFGAFHIHQVVGDLAQCIPKFMKEGLLGKNEHGNLTEEAEEAARVIDKLKSDVGVSNSALFDVYNELDDDDKQAYRLALISYPQRDEVPTYTDSAHVTLTSC